VFMVISPVFQPWVFDQGPGILGSKCKPPPPEVDVAFHRCPPERDLGGGVGLSKPTFSPTAAAAGPGHMAST